MENIKVRKSDVIWSYVAQALSIGVGILVLPFILTRLSTDEIGYNYILLTVGSIISLVDLGFSPQFARNFTYVLSGVKELKKNGVGTQGECINWELLATLLKTARWIYAILSIIGLLLLLGVGTPYVFKVTHGFKSVPNALIVWIVYSIGILFQIYYSYYFSMLLGSGKIKEQKIGLIGNKIIYLIVAIGGLLTGHGLLSVAFAQLISPFFGRYISYRYFYSKQIKDGLDLYPSISRTEILNTFKILWFNAKRTAVVQIGAYAIQKLSMFIAGLYMTLTEFSSYGLMVQLAGILGTVSCTGLQISQPRFASLRAKGDINSLFKDFSMSLVVYYLIFIVGGIVFSLLGEDILRILGSNAELPGHIILIVYCFILLLEYNHANFSILISANNNIPFAPASIITGIAVTAGTYLVLKYSNWGILGLVLAQGICQLAYQNWKWPAMAMREFNTSFGDIVETGAHELWIKIRQVI